MLLRTILRTGSRNAMLSISPKTFLACNPRMRRRFQNENGILLLLLHPLHEPSSPGGTHAISTALCRVVISAAWKIDSLCICPGVPMMDNAPAGGSQKAKLALARLLSPHPHHKAIADPSPASSWISDMRSSLYASGCPEGEDAPAEASEAGYAPNETTIQRGAKDRSGG